MKEYSFYIEQGGKKMVWKCLATSPAQAKDFYERRWTPKLIKVEVAGQKIDLGEMNDKDFISDYLKDHIGKEKKKKRNDYGDIFNDLFKNPFK